MSRSIHCELLIRQGRVEARVFAYLTDTDIDDWQSAIDIVLRGFAEQYDLIVDLAGLDQLLAGMGAEAFAERARRDLLATGETVRGPTSETRDVLTSEETQIARPAADGQTNPEIGALAISGS